MLIAMASRKYFFLWAVYPIAIFLLTVAFLAAINWGYESKLFTARADATEWNERFMGPILFAIGFGRALTGSAILFILGCFWPKSKPSWFIIPVTLVTILLVLPSLFIAYLGPAGMTMIEQTNSAPSSP